MVLGNLRCLTLSTQAIEKKKHSIFEIQVCLRGILIFMNEHVREEEFSREEEFLNIRMFVFPYICL